MLAEIKTEQILFLDIETVPKTYSFDELREEEKELWSLKTRYIQEREEKGPDEVYEKAGIYAEFGKVVCISTAFVVQGKEGVSIRVKSFYGEDERELLSEFGKMLHSHYSFPDKFLCGHNIKEFDIPFIARRMLINGLPLPTPINIAGKKPWEVRHLDTMELWKFGDYKHFTSLRLLTHIFGIPTPKDDISGADVSKVFWEENDLERIKIYCEKDTVAVVQLLRKFKNESIIPDENIKVV